MHFRPALAAAIAVAALAGCSKKDDKAADTADRERKPPAALVVTATDYAFAAPDTISSGLTVVRLINQGAEPHHISMFRLDSAHTLQDLQAMPDNGEPPAWLVAVGGPNAAAPGDSIRATIDLEPGNYAMLCFIPAADGKPHFMKGMARSLTVIPATEPGSEEPKADVDVALVDYDFQFSQPLTAGRHTLRITNNGPQDHEILIVRLAAGKTGQDFLAWTNAMQSGPMPGEVLNGIAGMSPGRHAFVSNNFTAGTYALICFVPDKKDGKPHFLHGMAKDITVS